MQKLIKFLSYAYFIGFVTPNAFNFMAEVYLAIAIPRERIECDECVISTSTFGAMYVVSVWVIPVITFLVGTGTGIGCGYIIKEATTHDLLSRADIDLEVANLLHFWPFVFGSLLFGFSRILWWEWWGLGLVFIQLAALVVDAFVVVVILSQLYHAIVTHEDVTHEDVTCEDVTHEGDVDELYGSGVDLENFNEAE